MTSLEHEQQVQQYIDQIEKELSITILPAIKSIWLNHNRANPESSFKIDITGKEPPPWRLPGYKGKLKPTPWVPGQPDYRLNTTQDQVIEMAYEDFALGRIDEDKLNQIVAMAYVKYPSA